MDVKINLAQEGQDADDIKACLITLVTTRAGDVPLDRSFGLDQSCLDAPLPLAQAMLTDELYNKVAQYEPRVVLNNVSFDLGDDGALIPILEVTLSE